MKLDSVHENDLIVGIIFTFIAFLLMGSVLILFYYFSKKKIVQHEFEKKDMEISHQKQLLKAVILTQEEERKRIAQDLHDDISSKLNIVSLNSHLLMSPGLSASELFEISTNVIKLTAKALENSRRIAHDLLPPVLEKFGLQAAIEELCHEHKTASTVAISFQSTLDFSQTEEQLQLQVFRILQELMNNSIRHGKATEISICFEEQVGNRVCNYIDNGIGFDIEAIKSKRGGLGMKNIESRIEIFNGSLLFRSSKNKGVNVTFTF